MTVMVLPSTGAPTAELVNWNSINWKEVVANARQLQMRIAKAYREGKQGKVKALQWILTHSLSAKLLAVKRVTQNDGAKTPGIDGVVWKTPAQKSQAALSLKRRGYQPEPLKRIYIPKKGKSKLRPLSIPVMHCRAQQALHLLSLEPIAEIIADKNAYGFRPLRSVTDAIERCFSILAQKGSARYILEGDIQSCFDTISSLWLQKHVPMDKEVLRKWLAASYMEKGRLYSINSGVPQGGIISPTLLNVTLSGLEEIIKTSTKLQDKVHVCIYADDFVITAATKEVLENEVRPIVETFLRERGLSLSQEKTKITHIDEGFDFLGMNIRKYGGKLIIKPAKSNVRAFLADIRETITSRKTVKTETLIRLINPKIRGWANNNRHVCSKDIFSYVDNAVFKAIWKWAVRRHPNKGKRWVKQKYFRTTNRNWVFSAKVKDKQSQNVYLDLALASKTPIKRHIKIRAEATPFDSAYHDYFGKRLESANYKQSRQKSNWWLRWWELL